MEFLLSDNDLIGGSITIQLKLYVPLPTVVVEFGGSPAPIPHTLQTGLQRWDRYLPRAAFCLLYGTQVTRGRKARIRNKN